MILKENGGGKEFEQASSGNHIARCVGLIDLGTQQSEYQGKTTYARKIVVRFELPNELTAGAKTLGKGGEPPAVGRSGTPELFAGHSA